ncbi:hypothetical protein CIL05_20225 [Virgibacillus profundi]|uniref:Uncharacterized protein n=1 Tax=Virgibacillus profundi TaxID=2024555 RepID=A0A2A2I9K5_9BACI|nr:hypothetical protein [Virgibacillus profundi]PAV27743.1 hypothetical protein CIL05_20225 [Virgibacillus profundi]PXY51898.1 hypothetical protein CIT14_20445 [Virgibacillus profundi]
MKYIILILVIASYLLAFSINLMPALKYPDSHMNILNSLVTILFMGLLLMYTKKGSRILKIFSMLGVISGVIVFVITTFEHAMIGNGILDVIASIQYPFYLIFITPLFGGNILFDLSYGSYSLLMSLFYGGVFGLTAYFRKN